MRTLVKILILRTYLFSFFISAVFVIVISQIELLDAVERGLKNLDQIFVLSLISYFPYVFFLSLPISVLKFSVSRRKKLFYLMSFSLKPQRLFFFCALIFFISSLLFSPLFYVSEKAKRKLSDKKAKNQTISIYISPQKELIYEEMRMKDDERRIFLISPSGKFSKLEKLPERKKFLVSSKSMDFYLLESPQKFFLFSLIISFGVFFSGVLGMFFGGKAIFVPIVDIFLAVFLTSIM
jgi:hypothetical protein